MARQLRIEYPGAIYHVMARGDRREPIVHNDGDRRAFLRTLEEMCERTGIHIYAYTLLDNHYHLVLTTPEGNLVKGMSWFQNTYTRRFNTYHNLWGHLFGGRYKSVLVEPGGNYFRSVINYVNLNPVRAGKEDLKSGIGLYPWASLKLFLGSPAGRPDWFKAVPVLAIFGLDDTPNGRTAYREKLEYIIRQQGPKSAARINGNSTPSETLQSTIKRGWYFGSKAFKDKLLASIENSSANSRHRGEDGYHGEMMQDHNEMQARKIIYEGCEFFGIQLNQLRSRRKNDIEKVLLAELISTHTSVRLDWLRNELGLGSRSYASRLIHQMRKRIDCIPKLRVKMNQLTKYVNIQ